ncbi:MAG: hypothetical protein HZA78_06980 [Candidatus Schekmanbacteria bacterium]|nr:hypothetical protein [Candidatus Schekmanbacteria bacterium]
MAKKDLPVVHQQHKNEPSSKNQRRINLLLSLCFILFLVGWLRFYLSDGHTCQLDGAPHSAQIHMLVTCLKNGEYPLWSNQWYAGFPFLQFYSPLFYYLAAGTSLIIHKVALSIKLILLLCHIISGVSAFLLIKEITDNHKAGLIGATAYALAPWHIFQLTFYGRFPISLIYAFLPLPFYFWEHYKHGKTARLRAFLWAGISLSLIIYSHYGYAVFVSLIFALYLLLDFSQQSQRSRLIFLLGTGITALVLSLYLLLPVVLEGQHLSGLEELLSRKAFEVNPPSLQVLLERKFQPQDHAGYLGLSFIILSIPGIIISLKEKKWALPLLWLFGWYLVLGAKTYLYRFIPLVYSQQAPERLIIYLILFIAILSGVSYTWLERQAKKIGGIKGEYFVFILVLLLCFADISFLTKRKWPEKYGTDEIISLTKLAYNPQAKFGARFFHVSLDQGNDWLFKGIVPAIVSLETKTNNLYGFFYQGATKILPLIDAGRTLAINDLKKQKYLADSGDFFYLMYTPYVGFLDHDHKFKLTDAVYCSPFIVAPELAYLSSEPLDQDKAWFLPRVLKAMRVDKARSVAAQLIIPSDIDQGANLTMKEPLDVKRIDYKQDLQHTDLKLSSNADCYLQLSHAWYPYLKVWLDDRETKFFPTALQLIGLYLPKGEHRIRVEPYLSPLRKGLLGLFIISWPGIIGFLIYHKVTNKQ